MAVRSVEIVVSPREPHWVGDGFRVHNFIPSGYRLSMERMSPFLVMDYNSKYFFEPSKTPRGVGVHPHKGFETVTIAYKGRIEHHDSSGGGGVIAEGDVIIAPYAPPATGNFNFEIDAAVISQNGGVQYLGEYNSNGQCTRGWGGSNQTFKYYGSLSSRQTWTWLWLKGSYSCGDAVYSASTGRYISGILNSTTQYDYNLLYAPPPSFPITSTYNILSWREVLTAP